MLAGRPVPLPPEKPGSATAQPEANEDAQAEAAAPPSPAPAKPSGGFVLFRPRDPGAPVRGASVPDDTPTDASEADAGDAAGEAAGAPHPAASARLAFVPLPPPRPGLARQAALAPPAAAPDEESADDSEEEAEPKAPSPPPAPGTAPPRNAGAPIAAPTLAKACPALAASGIAVFAPAPPPPTPFAGCGADKPVLLQGVKASNGRIIAFEPAALLRCDMADAVAHWVREDVEPLVGQLGSPLDTLFVADSYNCRSRNRVAGAKISEHGKGNAMDTHGYRMENGRQVTIGGKGDNAMPVDFQNALKASACGRFTTILGPGSDGYHEYHLHVDLAQRRSGGAYCHWAVRAATP
nr:extensin family protein [Ancylobacter crimeensis]